MFEFDISLFERQCNIVSIVNRMQFGRLRDCSLVPGWGNRFHKVSIPAWGPSGLLFGSFTEGYGRWCCNLTRHFHVVVLGLRRCGAIYPFCFQAFMACMGTTLLHFNVLYFILCFVGRASRYSRVMKTNSMHYLSSVYFISQLLHVLGTFVAHHQEVYWVPSLLGQQTVNWKAQHVPIVVYTGVPGGMCNTLGECSLC